MKIKLAPVLLALMAAPLAVSAPAGAALTSPYPTVATTCTATATAANTLRVTWDTATGSGSTATGKALVTFYDADGNEVDTASSTGFYAKSSDNAPRNFVVALPQSWAYASIAFNTFSNSSYASCSYTFHADGGPDEGTQVNPYATTCYVREVLANATDDTGVHDVWRLQFSFNAKEKGPKYPKAAAAMNLNGVSAFADASATRLRGTVYEYDDAASNVGSADVTFVPAPFDTDSGPAVVNAYWDACTARF